MHVTSITERPSLPQLVDLLVSGNDVPVGYRGTFSDYDGDGQVKNRWRVWRLRHLARVEDPPGRLSLLAGEDSYWVWWPSEEGVLTFSRTADNPCNFELSTLRMLNPRRYWNDWLGADARLVTETLRAVEHEGRPAWSFTAPYVKGGSPELTVDAELGLVVRSWRDDVGRIQEWTDLHVDPSLDASFFEYREG